MPEPNTTGRVRRITTILCNLYPDRRPLLTFSNPFELLISVILSAQTTDAGVNRVTPALFATYPTPDALAEAQAGDVEQFVHSTGFYRNKARNVIGAAQALRDRFDGKVPESMDDLVSIPGVGRKTANVMRGVVFGLPGIVVDTHLGRVSNRLGLVNTKNPNVIERALSDLVPEEIQIDFSMSVNLHGRARCHARSPQCDACEIRRLCPTGSGQ